MKIPKNLWQSLAMVHWYPLKAIAFFFSFAIISVNAQISKAQISPDATLGTDSSRVTPDVLIRGANSDLIEGGARRDSNLFHSFSSFNVAEGRRVYFSNPSGIDNIITRVTGGSASNILGTLGVDGSANLFLINPSGIVFRNNANLDIGGSFFASTANSFVFDDGKEFSATNPQEPPLLSVNLSPGLQYGKQASGDIIQQGNLAVGVGKNLTLFGNTLLNSGSLTALNGEVDVIGSQVAFIINPDTQDLQNPQSLFISILANKFNIQATESIFFNAQLFIALPNTQFNAQAVNNIAVNQPFTNNGGETRLTAEKGNINIQANLLSSGGEMFLKAGEELTLQNTVTGTSEVNRAGDLFINAKKVNFNENAILTSSTISNGDSGNIQIQGDDISMAASSSRIIALGTGSGNGGKISLIADNLTVKNGAIIVSSARDSGNSGEIDIRANSAEITGTDANDSPTSLITNHFAYISDISNLNSGGNISINVGNLRFGDGAIISTAANGESGNIYIRAEEKVDINAGAIDTSSLSIAGNLEIDANKIIIQNSGLTTSSLNIFNSFESIKGGNIVINTDDSVVISRSFISSSTVGEADGGNVAINTGNFTLENFSFLSTSNFGTGSSGNLDLKATNNVDITSNSALSTLNLGFGKGGNISVDTKTLNLDSGGIATESLDIDTFPRPSLQNQNIPNPGFTEFSLALINASPNSLLNISQIYDLFFDGIQTSLQTIPEENRVFGESGNLTIRATESIRVSNKDRVFADDAVVSTRAKGRVSGGKVSIETPRMTIENQAKIATDTAGNGSAGLLQIRTSDLLEIRGEGSEITTRAVKNSTGDGGKMLIETGNFVIADNADISSATFGQGKGGDIEVKADSFSLVYGGRVTSLSDGTGDAGNISLEIKDNLRSFSGEITATSARAGGGNISMEGTDTRLGDRSLVSTSVADGRGGGGNIRIGSDVLVILEDSDILANADAGVGGNITIQSPVFVAEFGDGQRADALGRNFGDFAQFRGNGRVDISADSRLSTSGEIGIDSLEPDRNLIELPIRLVEQSDQIGRLCPRSAKLARNLSKFVITGRGSLPPSPFNPLVGKLDSGNLATLQGTTEEVSRIGSQKDVDRKDNDSRTYPRKIIEAQSIVKNADGEIYLVSPLQNNDNAFSKSLKECFELETQK